MSASAADRLRARAEERVVELQATAAEAITTGQRLLAYDDSENRAHLTLRHADERTADILERQLVAGDVGEAAMLRTVRDRLVHIGDEAHALAGDLSRLLDTRAQVELFPVEAAS